MLIRFNATNFMSFKEETEFNMLAAKSLKTHADHVYSIKRGIKVLKGSAIYGANGAGKSNLIKGIDTLQTMVNEGCIPRNVHKMKYRLNEQNLQEPITLEIEFSHKEIVYSYGITFDDNIIMEEWLYKTGTNRSELIFTRQYSDKKKRPILRFADKYMQNHKMLTLISVIEENLLEPDSLLISKHNVIKHKEISNAYEWIAKMLQIIFPDSITGIATRLYSEETESIAFSQLIQSFNVGIDGLIFSRESLEHLINEPGINSDMMINIKKMLDEEDDINVHIGRDITAFKENGEYFYVKIQTNHGKTNFDLDEESDGTQRLFDFIPVLRQLLKEKKTFIIDEIDRSLHPSIIHSLIRKIMADDSTQGQLIFTTHESSLLSCKIFRADEIWFAEKKDNATQLYTLNEFKPRADLDIEKGYLNGRFGAIPFLSKLDNLDWHQ